MFGGKSTVLRVTRMSVLIVWSLKASLSTQKVSVGTVEMLLDLDICPLFDHLEQSKHLVS